MVITRALGMCIVLMDCAYFLILNCMVHVNPSFARIV